MSDINESSYPGLPPSSPVAAAYGERAFELARATGLKPAGILNYGDHASQCLEVYVPQVAVRAPLPVLLFFHGGAWVSGGLSWLRFMAPAVTSLPAIYVAGTYRLAPEFRWPSAYEDVCAAVAAVHTGISRWGGDASRLIVGGHSSGGHLAALAVLQSRATPVLACFPVSSSFDLRYGDVPLDSPEGRVYRYLFERREQDEQASPIVHVAGNHVPFHIVWGERDFDRITRTSQAMAGALALAGSRVTTAVVPESDHFGTHLRLADSADPWYVRLHKEMHDDR